MAKSNNSKSVSTKDKGSPAYVVVSMYTPDTPYEDEVKFLEKSCEKFGIKYKSYPIENLNDWVRNTQQKANVIAKALEDFSCDVLWLDADAEVLKPLVLFDEWAKRDDFHIAIHRAHYGKAGDDHNRSLRSRISDYLKRRRHPKGEIISNTIYVKNSAMSKKLVAEWIEKNSHEREWDQRTLQEILDRNDCPYKVKQLPVEYAKIVPRNSSLRDISDGKNFIGQKQASRRLRQKIGQEIG